MDNKKFTKENQSKLLALVCEEFVVEAEEVLSSDRRSRQSNARHVAMSLMKILLDCTYAEIGVVFNRNYSTVITAHRKLDASTRLQETALKIAKKYKALFKPE